MSKGQWEPRSTSAGILFFGACALAAPCSGYSQARRPPSSQELLAEVGPPPIVDAGGRFLVPEVPSTWSSIDVTDCDVTGWPPALSVTPLQTSGLPSFSLALVISHPDNPLLDEELYVFIQVTDGSPDPGDNVLLMLDNSHDHTVPTAGTAYEADDDRGVRFFRDKTFQRIHGSALSPDPGPSATLTGCIHGGAPGGGVGGGSWTVEAKLSPADFGLNQFNALVGGIVVTTSTGSTSHGVWPMGAQANPASWANLLTRSPIDFILLVDQSGSMTGSKWTSAKQAGDNFAMALSQVKDNLDLEFSNLASPLAGDQRGLANFTWTTADQSSTVVPLGTIPAPTPGNSFTSALPTNPGGWTPIAGGINRTFVMFGGAPTFPGPVRTRVVLLLSDGIHNKPNGMINFDVEGVDLTYLPSTPACGFAGRTNFSLVRINTVAVGTDATVDVGKLDQIKNCYSGSRFTTPDLVTTNTYNIADPAEGQLSARLTKFFVQTLQPYYHWNTINEDGSNFTINAGDRKLLLFAFWDTKANATDLTILTPGGIATGAHDATLGYSWLLIDKPAAGSYTSFSASGAAAKFVFVDLRVRGDFAVDNLPHRTGSTILLRARLRDGGQAVTGAVVRVDIARPGEGFGTYVSTHSLDDCNSHPPILPAVEQSEALRRTRAAVAGPDTSGPDHATPRFSRIAALFEHCGKSGLDRMTDSGLPLFDDGTHGDIIANDGIYTLAMENTQYEGSYAFRFRASGRGTDGGQFTRVREMAEYVAVGVDPGASASGARILHVAPGLVRQEVFVIPRDRRGEYLGPGYVERVQFRVRGGGAAIGSVVDYNNGIYSQVVQYDPGRDRPVVRPVVDGVALRPVAFQPAWELVLPYAGRTWYDNALPVHDGTPVGARLGYRLASQLSLEVEGGVTFAKDFTGVSGRAIQVLGNLRWDMRPLRIGNWMPYLTAGAGYVLFRGFSSDDGAPVYQGGIGSTLQLRPTFGFRADARVFRIADVYSAGSTTSYQVTGGLVWSF